MRSKNRILISLLVVLLMAIALSACGGGNSTDTSSTDTEDAVTEEATNADEESTTDNSDTVAAKEPPYKIGYINGYYGNTWRTQFIEDLEAAGERYKEEGLISELVIGNSNNDSTEALNQMMSMVNDPDMDAIIVCPAAPTGIASGVEAAKAKGILVVSGNDPSYYEGVYGIFNPVAAYTGIAMEWAVTKLGNEFNMVNIYGVPGNGAETARDEATKAVLAENPGIKVLGEAQGNWSISDTQAAMSQLLAANGDNIDFVLSQEGADGVIRAYELAGKKLPPYNSDTTAASLRAWKDAGVDSVGVPAPCSIGAANVRFTINLLQGKKLDESKLTANPLEPSAKTAITLEPSYIVIAKEYQDAEWISNYSHSKLLTIDEAVEMVKDKPETYILDVLFEDDYIDSFFLTE